ncbi:MAG: SIS domain-containing protein [Elusimicrobia bacterium]|nr:SIS domain-containing protein [Elusimicrobiota bacterium]
MSFAADYFANLGKALAEMPQEQIDTLFRWMKEAYDQEKLIFVMGNGGSATTASHFVCDMNKGVSMNLKKKFRLMALNDNQPTLTAYANDVSYDAVFSRPLENFLGPGDLVIGFSTSGNSKNVIKAFDFACRRGNKTFAILGRPGGGLIKVAEASLVVPTSDVQQAEDLHHCLCHMIMRRFCAELGVKPAGKTV